MNRIPSYFRTLTPGPTTMAIQTYYVNAKSKKELNERLAANKYVTATCYAFMNEHAKDILNLNDGDVIKIYDKIINGSPYAKAYGNWNAKTKRVK